jgi:hypothetical protein
MKKVPEVGDIIIIKSFSFTSKEGGTGISDWDHDEKWNRPAKFAVVKEWEDSECGQRGWAIPDQTDEELMAYMRRNVKEGKPKISISNPFAWKNENGVYIIFWSEFDIIDVK